jgi:iron complex outermembrane receptor protein
VVFATGLQSSEVQTSPSGNIEIPYTDRVSDTRYFDLRAHAYGFQLQANHMSGDQDMERNFTGWKISPQVMNTSLEYEKSFGTLVLRPGISYQAAIYDDSKHLTQAEQEAKLGFLNGAPELNTLSLFLRADYKILDKLRTIAAIRSDKYNVPDKTYLTYQFISSYDINSNHVVRAVYSRANRGPFIVDSYADYDWPVIPQNNSGMVPYTLIWRGNKNLEMPVVDMIEVGYRFKPMKNIMVDLEAFYNYTRDVNYFLPDSMSMSFNFTTGKPNNTEGNVKYYNMDITSKQYGITANVSVVLNEKLTLKTYMTYQQSRLDNVYPKSLWNNIDDLKNQFPAKITADGYLLTVANGALTAQGKIAAGITPTPQETAMAQIYQSFNTQQLSRLGFLMTNLTNVTYAVGNPDIVNGAVVDSALVSNNTNQATPDLYGGFAIDYSPTKKLNIYLSTYFYSKHSIIINRKEYAVNNGFWRGFDIDPKFMVNLKVSYKVWKDNSIFINTRNLLNNDKHEFAYSDKINGTYMVGFNLNF